MTLGAPRTGRITAALIVGDGLAVYGAFWLAFLIRFKGHIPAYNWGPFQDMAPWLVLASLALLYGVGLYYQGPVPAREEIVGAWVASGLYLLLGMGISYAGATYAIPRSVFIIQAPLQAALVVLVHGAVNLLVLRWAGPIPLVVVGEAGRARLATRRLQQAGGGRWTVVTVEVDPNLSDKLPGACSDGFPERPFWLYLDNELPGHLRSRLIVAALERQATLLVSPQDVELLLYGSSSFAHVGDMLLAVVRPFKPAVDVRILKRVADLLAAVVLGVLSAPFWLMAALLVRLTSPGPVLYRQPRVGENGKTFVLLKFRTMVDGAEKETGAVMAIEDDPRVTPVGRFLRATRIDELPQIVNVLRGDMSVVGPRPERPEFVRQYEREFPLYRFRHAVKPGITGLAQVFGNYGTPIEDKLRFDLLYVRNHSPLMDLQILLQTVKVVLLPERAKGLSSEMGDQGLFAPVEGVREVAASGGQDDALQDLPAPGPEPQSSLSRTDDAAARWGAERG